MLDREHLNSRMMTNCSIRFLLHARYSIYPFVVNPIAYLSLTNNSSKFPAWVVGRELDQTCDSSAIRNAAYFFRLSPPRIPLCRSSSLTATYTHQKAGVIGMTMSMAREFAGRGVTVNAVCPGFIESDMTAELDQDAIKKMIPLGRLGKPEEIAGMVK